MSLEKGLGEELNHCRNCGRQSLGHMIIEGKKFCNWVCVSEWRWRKSRTSEKKERKENE